MCIILGGFSRSNGINGECIWGGCFKDENFLVKHDTEGIITMANDGPDRNRRYIFIL
jgi:cyclophilin family peptidyl-prolyl cis-trans isomerase